MCTLSFYFVPTCVVMLVCNEIKHLDKASQSRKLYSILKLSRLIAPCSLNRQTHVHKTCTQHTQNTCTLSTEGSSLQAAVAGHTGAPSPRTHRPKGITKAGCARGAGVRHLP